MVFEIYTVIVNRVGKISFPTRAPGVRQLAVIFHLEVRVH